MTKNRMRVRISDLERRITMANVDPLLEKLCKENGLTPEDFPTQQEFFEMGVPDEEGE